MKKFSQGNKEVTRNSEDLMNLDLSGSKKKEKGQKENNISAQKQSEQQKQKNKGNNNTNTDQNKNAIVNEDSLSNGQLEVYQKQSPTKQNRSINSQNLSTLKYISNEEAIEITPNEIHFKDIQINQTYEITLYVRNLTKTARRIRVFQPQTPSFRADYEMQGAIAAGLAMKITVTFETTYLDNFKDVMKIVSDDSFSKEIQLFAYMPSAQIVFEPFINFGFVKVQQLKKEKIYFKNEGTVATKVELKSSDPADLKVDTPFFNIGPKQEFVVQATYESQEAGLFRGFIYVTTDAQCLQKIIDINATTVEFTKFLIDDAGNQSTQFDFGTFYYGQQKMLNGFLVNNTPKKYKFKVNFRFGLLYSAEDIASLQTPNEVGREQTEKIMSVEPSEGVIESYSQIPITFKCHSSVHPKHQFWTQSYAISKDEMNPDVEDYSYSAIFSYDGISQSPTIIHVTGRGICPTIKLSKSLIQYGECNVNDYKDCKLEVENRNRDIPIPITCTKIPYFTLSPNSTVINPQSKFTLVASFQPKAVGSFQKNMQIILLNGAYNLDLKMLGKALDISEKTINRRGPEILPENFETERKYVDDENLFQTRTKKQYEDRINEIPDWVMNNKDQTVMDSYLNGKKYDDVIREHRKDRLQKEKDKVVSKKYDEMLDKLKQLGLGPDSQTNVKGGDSDDDGKEGRFADAPIDYAYEVGMIQNRLDTPELALPVSNEPLYVNKPIGKYEPYNQDNMKTFNPDPNAIIKKKWHFKPHNHKEIREISMKLQGEQLQKIFAGPVFIDFGPVYVKSIIQKTFTIRNDLRTTISCRLIVDCDELKGSYQSLQIIPPSQVAGFDVVLMSNTLGQFRNNIKYIINEQHAFEFQVIADIQLVKLELSRVQIKMSFFEDNHDMITKETLKLTNNGNANGKFEWIHTPQRVFTITPEKGEVLANSSLTLTVTYRPSQQLGHHSLQSQNSLQPPNSNPDRNSSNPSGSGNNQNDKQSMAAITRNEEEKIILKVYDGVEGSVKCTGTIQEAKCLIKNSNLDFKEIAVSKPETKTFSIKNLSKIQAIFSIDQGQLPECVTISPMKGRIGPDDQREISVTCMSSVEQVIKGDIVVMIRGGRILKLPFIAQTIIPQVSILEEAFDFGNITTLGNQGILKLTLQNNSNIPADLVLDMRNDEDYEQAQAGIECLIVEIDGDDDDSVLHSVHEEADEDENDQNNNGQDDEPDFDGPLNESGDSMDEESEKKKSKLFNLTIYPKQTINFILKFCPKEITTYKLLLPITLAGYGMIPSLERYVSCKGLHPKFLIDPQTCEFKRKVITTPDKCFPDKMEVTLNNPDRRSIKWRIDTSGITSDKIFSVEPSFGVVDSCDQQIIEAYFNPYSPGNFVQTLPLYIDDDDEIPSNVPYVELLLKGEAAFPRLQFDRKEVILPVVPLGIESRCIFRIINDGYENLNLKYKIIQDISNINVTLNWLDGKNLGITKHRLRVEAVFSNKKALSFTTRIEFYDDSDRVYPIHISGTTDNCLFTNFPYLQRCKGEYSISINEQKDESGKIMYGNIIIQEEDDDVNSVDDRTQTSRTHSMAATKKRGGAASTLSYGSTKSSRSMLGYQPIPTPLLDQTIEHITRWLNYHVLQAPINNYPQSVVELNGSPIFDLITFLTGKSQFPFRAQIDHLTKRTEKSKKLMAQYDELIRSLKTEGAMLNHIRPEYLLSYQDYIQFVKGLPNQVTNTISSNVLRMPQTRFMYLQLDSWITLFYQILKIYFLNRLNGKNFKLIPGIPAEKMSLPPYIEQSNLISPAESLILYWLELNYELTHPLAQKRLCSFDQDLQDGVWIQSLVMSYVGKNSARYFGNMKMVCSNEADFKYNGERIIDAMKEIGINSHLQPQDFQKSSMRELILFNLQMIYSLPHYIPKGNPITFSCILGEEVVKNIELTNPTNRTICYNVKLEGHPDFSLDSEDQFMIEPKSPFKFRVKFTSRVSDPISARIIFNNKKESNVQAAALVFDLKSNVTGRVSEKIIQTTSSLYENTEFQFQVTNKFQNSEWGEFEVNIIHVKPEKPVEKKKKKALTAQPNQNNTKGKGVGNKDEENEKNLTNITKLEEQANEIFPSFFCRQYNTSRLRIKRGATSNINLIFLPLIMESSRCFIIFKDPNLGEFQYEVLGSVEPPMFNNETIKLPQSGQMIFVDDPANLEIPLSYQNEAMNRARKLAEQLIMEKSKEKFLKGDKTALMKADKLIFPGGQPDQIIYNIEMQPSVGFIQIPQVFTLQNPFKAISMNVVIEKEQPKPEITKRGKHAHKEQAEEQQETSQIVDLVNKFPISALFKNAVKDFKIALTLKNENLTDIRRYRVEISAHPKPVRANLEFRVPARQSTTQEIPIVNNTERDWTIKVNCIKDKLLNSNLFSYPQQFQKEFLVRKKSQGFFPLTFKPKWICEAECKLILQNPLTNDLFEYSIKGFGEEPVAEDHFVLQCSARATKVHEISIKNPYTDRDINYKVETDLLNAQGAPTLKIKAGQKGTYKLSVTPILSGQYTGSITFTEDDGTYLWYTVVLTTASPAADKILDLNSFIRQACTFEISIQNPLDQQISFDVIINGDGLIGESIFYMDAKETKSYELVFSPLFVGKAKGSIAFVNEHLGEKWYELNLFSEEQAIIKLPILKTELGKFTQHKVLLENPTGKEIKAISKCSNPQNFEVFPSDIVLKPFTSTTVFIRHTPSSLEQSEIAELQIITGEIGKWKYSIFGMGIPPTKFGKREISVSINKDFSTSIQFKNPFKEQIQVQVYMVAENQNKEVFKLLLKGKRIPGKEEGEDRFLVQVGGMQVLMVPISFIPREITKYYCEIVLAMNDKIEWKYPIEGITQCTQSTIIQTFKCSCREVLEEDFSIQLPGIASIIGKDDTFSFEIKCLEDEEQTLVNKSLSIKTTKNYLSDPGDKLEFSVKFQPLKPYKATLEFHILRKAGGKWRYFIDVEASEPEPDDLIVISSHLHKTTSVSFKLTNKTKQFAPFTANFSPESDSEFTVFPKSGILESYGRDGTTFIISFTPVEYGKIRNGKLVIQTEDMYWSYLIKGKLPKYNPPQAENSLIDDRLEAEFDLRVNSTLPKNHLIDNIKKSKINPNLSKKSFSRSIQNSNDSTNVISRTMGMINNMSSSISYIGKNPQ